MVSLRLQILLCSERQSICRSVGFEIAFLSHDSKATKKR